MQVIDLSRCFSCSVYKNKGDLAVLQVDLTDVPSLERKGDEAAEIYGHVDILINNAGISYRGSIQDTDIDVHMKVMTVNYFGQIALTKGMHALSF